MKNSLGIVFLMTLSLYSCVSQQVFKSSIESTNLRINNIEKAINDNIRSNLYVLQNQINTTDNEVQYLKQELSKMKSTINNQEEEINVAIKKAEDKINNLDRTLAELRIELLKLKQR